MLALLAAVAALARPARARLHVRARGLSSTDALERTVLEYSRVLRTLFGERCRPDDGCMLVEVTWSPGDTPHDSALEMRLELLHNETSAGQEVEPPHQ